MKVTLKTMVVFDAYLEQHYGGKPVKEPEYRWPFSIMGLKGDLLANIENISRKVSVVSGMNLNESDYLISRLIVRQDEASLMRLVDAADCFFLTTSDQRAFSEAVQSFGYQLRETVDRNIKAVHKYLNRIF